MEVLEIGAMNNAFNEKGEKMNTVKQLEELRNNISEWGRKNGITINGKVEGQMLKLNSEASEISEAILEGDGSKFIDAIGDTFVVMVMVADILKRELNSDELDLRMVGYDKKITIGRDDLDFGLLFKFQVELGELNDLIAKGRYDASFTALNEMLSALNALAEDSNNKLVECIEVAYNEIKDRVGFLTPDGVYVKSTDPEYENVVKQFKGK